MYKQRVLAQVSGGRDGTAERIPSRKQLEKDKDNQSNRVYFCPQDTKMTTILTKFLADVSNIDCVLYSPEAIGRMVKKVRSEIDKGNLKSQVESC